MFLRRAVLGSALVVALVSSYGDEIIVDDVDPLVQPADFDMGSTIYGQGKNGAVGNPWTKIDGNCSEEGFRGGFHVGFMLTGGKSLATYRFHVPKTGCYWVEEFHPDTSKCDFALSPSVPIRITSHKGVHSSGVIDQTQRGGKWNKMTKMQFYKNHPASINITAGNFKFKNIGLWAADAFRLSWHDEFCHDEDWNEEDWNVENMPSKMEVRLAQTQGLVDDDDIHIPGATKKPRWECPATTEGTFHHDNFHKPYNKNKNVTEATFSFNPPHDGCYLIEEKHPDCFRVASNETKVHISYCKAPLQAVGTVDQTAPAGEWTFIATLQFYAGYPGHVTLSNEGTKPGTLAVFDRVRFTRVGETCFHPDAHTRRVELRFTMDFKHVADHLEHFGKALKSKLAYLAMIPESSLRLVGIREGSIIAEFFVVPSVVDEPLATARSPKQTIKLLKWAVEAPMSQIELCGLTKAYGEIKYGFRCSAEIKDLGFAMPTVKAPPVKAPCCVMPEELAKEEQSETQAVGNNAIIAICVAIVAMFAAITGWYVARARKMKRKASKADTADIHEEPGQARQWQLSQFKLFQFKRKGTQVQAAPSKVDADMEAGAKWEADAVWNDMVVAFEKPGKDFEEDDEKASTVCPSEGKSEPSIYENGFDHEVQSQASRQSVGSGNKGRGPGYAFSAPFRK